MRLTLRTLLAYTDDILDPADHEELGRKIEASDFATDLIHRSRDTLRRLRLGAPDVLASGGDDVLESVSVADANAVAEYLDNTLPPEEVADFERMCLEPGNEADMHLAEVASCHHVLTMVLGEAAEIDLDVRRRMYELPEKLASGQKLRIESGHVAHQQASSAQAPLPEPATPSAAPPAPRIEPSAPGVPDYLRAAADQRQRGKRWAMIAALLAVAGIGGFFMSEKFMETRVPTELAKGELDSIAGELKSEGAGDTEVGSSGAAEGKDGQPTAEAPALVSGFEASESEVSSFTVDEFDPESVSASPDDSTDSTDLRLPQTTVPADGQPLDLDSEFPEIAPEAGHGDSESLATTTKERSVEAPEAFSEDAEMAEAVAPEEKPLLGATADRTDGNAVTNDQDAPSQVRGPVQLGSYLGNNDVLLRYDSDADKWLRLPPRSAVSTGDFLLALPKFRPHVVLADVNAYLSGGTQVELPIGEAAVGDEGTNLELSIVYGRVLLNAGLNGSRIALLVGDEVRQIQLGGSASLAIEVQRVFVPGSDNEQESSPVEAKWYLTSGSVDWPAAIGDPLSIQAPATWSTVDGIDDLPQPIEQLPEWIDGEPMTDLQRRARDTLAEELAPGEPVGIRLLELNDRQEKGRRREVRTLAAESSVYVGQFEPFVKALSDKDQRRAWETHILTLRQALARSPDIAARVRNAFVDLRGEQAANDLMEMVAGYDQEAIGDTRESVQEGAIVKLIRRLESDSLDYRVLAIYNLNEIAGTSSLKGFSPDDSAKGRKISVAKIWDSFQSNELMPKP